MEDKKNEKDIRDERIIKLKNSLDKLKNKDFTIYFLVPDVKETQSLSIYEIYFHADVLKKNGYKVKIVTETENYEKPTWFDNDMVDNLDYINSESKDLTLSFEDFVVIPEIYSFVMEKFSQNNVPAERIVFTQSVDVMINSLPPSVNWKMFGVENVITTSEVLKSFIEDFYGNNLFDIRYYNIGIPDYFKKPDTPKKPIVSILTRNPNDAAKLTKLFFLKFPQHRYLTFEFLQGYNRKDFAKRLSETFAGIWIDRISSFGTFPVECMKCETIPIGLVPDLMPKYIMDHSGAWTNSLYQIPDLLNHILNRYLEDKIDDKIYETMNMIGNQHTESVASSQIIEIYDHFINKRISFVNDIIKKSEEK